MRTLGRVRECPRRGLRGSGPVTADLAAAEALSRNEVLGLLSAADLDEVLRFARRSKLGRGHVIFHKGDPGDALYAILEGRVGISASSGLGKQVFLNILEPGEVFGEIALLDGGLRTAEATVMEAAVLLRIDRARFLPFLEQRPRLCLKLMELLCSRLRWTSDIIESIVFLDIPRRLAKRLLILADEHGRHMGHDVQVDVGLSQEDLANMLGATRESVNKVLRAFQQQGLIAYGRGRLRILNSQALQEVATE